MFKWLRALFGLDPPPARSVQNTFQPPIPRVILFSRQTGASSLIAILDVETTGLGATDQPISIGALLVEVETSKGDHIRELDSYYGLREPTVPIHPKAFAVHGIDIGTLRGRAFDMTRLSRIIDSADLLVAHNAKFDRRMLAHVMPQVMCAKWACSMYTLKHELARISPGKASLDSICASLRVERQSPHNALSDCRALQAVLMARAGKTERSQRLMGRLIKNAWAPSP